MTDSYTTYQHLDRNGNWYILIVNHSKKWLHSGYYLSRQGTEIKLPSKKKVNDIKNDFIRQGFKELTSSQYEKKRY